jgi:predicted dehydrogenase
MIHVGLIGAGFIGRNHFNQYEKMAGRVQVALCDKEADRRAGDWSKVGGNIADARGTRRDLGGITTYDDWHKLLADPELDMVDLCVPTKLHREITVAALRAGKHVLCEKPMALTVEDCDAMLAAAAESKGKLMIAQCIRFWPEYVYLKRVLDEGRLGGLKALSLRRQASEPDYTLGNWSMDPNVSGGAILDLHVHDVDFAIHLLGKPRSVCAQGYRRENGAVDRIHALWHYEPDLVVELQGYWDIPAGFGFNMGFTAVFEKGAVVWDMDSTRPLTIYTRGAEPVIPEVTGPEGYFVEIDYFLGCIERDEEPRLSTPEESRDAVAIALAEKESAQTARPVRII